MRRETNCSVASDPQRLVSTQEQAGGPTTARNPFLNAIPLRQSISLVAGAPRLSSLGGDQRRRATADVMNHPTLMDLNSPADYHWRCCCTGLDCHESEYATIQDLILHMRSSHGISIVPYNN